MIARVAQRNPGAIPESAARKLAPIFNIDQMAQAYRSEDAASTGIRLHWRTTCATPPRQS